MIDKETYKKELMRMFASFRGDSAKFEYCFCRCEQCDNCPLLDCCHMHGTVRPYDVFEVIEKVEKWSKEHQKFTVSKLEYDILKSYIESLEGVYFVDHEPLMRLLERGYFKGATSKTKLVEYYNNCEVDE